jgi:type IV secretion system protein VirB11
MNELLSHATALLGITPHLDNPAIREIRITSEGLCFLIHSTQGKVEGSPVCLDYLDAFLALIASHHGQEFDANHPRLATGDPALGFRIQASRPPVSPGPNMVLRKHPSQVYTLEQFVTDGILTPLQRGTIESALTARKTIVVAGEMGSGKTSLVNACLDYIQATKERIVIIEDTPEIVCHAADVKFYCAVPTLGITLRNLCSDLLRESPDRIVVGEVRGGEAVDALRACQTGHPGLFTVHAKSAAETPTMLEQRIQEVSASPQQALIASAIDFIVHMEHFHPLFRCTDILRLEGWNKKTGYILKGAAACIQ